MKTLKTLVILAAFAGSFPSCSKDESKDWLPIVFGVVHDESTSIVGKWKLEKVISIDLKHGYILHDFSRRNVVYEFKTDNTLTVTGNTNPNHWYCARNGDYSYAIEIIESAGISIKIYYSGGCSFNSQEMVINYALLDGPFYYFTRITPKK